MTNSFRKDKSRNRLIIFGTRCRLFPLDDDALKSEMLVPWSNDNSLLIDKYDARCWLTDISSDEFVEELTKEEEDIDLLCDEERYRDLYSKLAKKAEIISNCSNKSPEAEEKQECQFNNNYAAVNYSYEPDEEKAETVTSDAPDVKSEVIVSPENEDDIPYQCPSNLEVPNDIEMPSTERQAAKIEKTALFIANQGLQMEILLKAKQAKSDQFCFLEQSDKLYPFYKFVLEKIKSAEYVPPVRRELCHLTKSDGDNYLDSVVLPKIDISNTAYFKLINKFRPTINDISNKSDVAVDYGCSEDARSVVLASVHNSDSLPPIVSDNKIKKDDHDVDDDTSVHNQLFQQYFTYYYDYYYRLHQNNAILQEAGVEHVQQESKTLAAAAATIAVRAGIEQMQTERQEKEQLENERSEIMSTIRLQCAAVRYADLLCRYEDELAAMDNQLLSDNRLPFRRIDHGVYPFYRGCLRRIKTNLLKTSCEQEQQPQQEKQTARKLLRWRDLIRPFSDGPLVDTLPSEQQQQVITCQTEAEYRLTQAVERISTIVNGEAIGVSKYKREISDANIDPILCSEDIRAARKRKASQFLERRMIRQDGNKNDNNSEHIVVQPPPRKVKAETSLSVTRLCQIE